MTVNVPIACTLQADMLRGRAAALQQLACDALLGHEVQGTTARLLYRKSAAARLAELVAAERECCSFLDFDLLETDAGIALTMAAPEDCAADARLLFELFLPA